MKKSDLGQFSPYLEMGPFLRHSEEDSLFPGGKGTALPPPGGTGSW